MTDETGRVLAVMKNLSLRPVLKEDKAIQTDHKDEIADIIERLQHGEIDVSEADELTEGILHE
jgi:hypothetical protein